MTSTMNLSLTDELRSFVDANCGEGTDYATPSEFLRDIIRERKAKQEALELRNAILDGYKDVIAGNVVQYNGNIRETLAQARKNES